jgi:hypothetical protein
MTLLSAGVSAGFSVAGLLGPGKDDSFAQYAASRSVALLLTVLIAMGIRSRMAIAFLGIAMTVMQAFDGVIGARLPTILRRPTDRLVAHRSALASFCVSTVSYASAPFNAEVIRVSLLRASLYAGAFYPLW